MSTVVKIVAARALLSTAVVAGARLIESLGIPVPDGFESALSLFIDSTLVCVGFVIDGRFIAPAGKPDAA